MCKSRAKCARTAHEDGTGMSGGQQGELCHRNQQTADGQGGTGPSGKSPLGLGVRSQVTFTRGGEGAGQGQNRDCRLQDKM